MFLLHSIIWMSAILNKSCTCKSYSNSLSRRHIRIWMISFMIRFSKPSKSIRDTNFELLAPRKISPDWTLSWDDSSGKTWFANNRLGLPKECFSSVSRVTPKALHSARVFTSQMLWRVSFRIGSSALKQLKT